MRMPKSVFCRFLKEIYRARSVAYNKIALYFIPWFVYFAKAMFAFIKFWCLSSTSRNDFIKLFFGFLWSFRYNTVICWWFWCYSVVLSLVMCYHWWWILYQIWMTKKYYKPCNKIKIIFNFINFNKYFISK